MVLNLSATGKTVQEVCWSLNSWIKTWATDLLRKENRYLHHLLIVLPNAEMKQCNGVAVWAWLYWKPLGIDCLFLRNCRTTLMLLGRVNVYFNHIWTFHSWPVWFAKCRSEERTHMLTHINTKQPEFLSIVEARRNPQSSPAVFFGVFTRQSTLQAGRSEGNE